MDWLIPPSFTALEAKVEVSPPWHTYRRSHKLIERLSLQPQVPQLHCIKTSRKPSSLTSEPLTRIRNHTCVVQLYWTSSVSLCKCLFFFSLYAGVVRAAREQTVIRCRGCFQWASRTPPATSCTANSSSQLQATARRGPSVKAPCWYLGFSSGRQVVHPLSHLCLSQAQTKDTAWAGDASTSFGLQHQGGKGK